MILCQKIKSEHSAVADVTQLSEANKNYTIKKIIKLKAKHSNTLKSI